jgi:uncharacterized membrane protein
VSRAEPLAVTLARVETKLDDALTVVGDHEGRIRTLERWQWRLTGASALGGGLLGALGADLVQMIHVPGI